MDGMEWMDGWMDGLNGWLGVFAIDHKNVTTYITNLLKAVKNKNVCDVKYITTCTNLVYH